MDVDAYLDRIGVDRTASLHDMHRAHQETVPFENLSIHLGEPISLSPDDLFDKIVRRRRGGFCYELNGLFALLLEALGHKVVRAGARVYRTPESLGPPFDHLALLADAGDGQEPWIADVGFGRHSAYPLRLGEPSGQFLVAAAPDGDLDVFRDGVPQYRLETRPRSLEDFGPTCWWQSTSPDSHFTRGPVCSRLDGDGRISISGRTLIRTKGETRTETTLDTDESLVAAYREHFGIDIDLDNGGHDALLLR
ncbi:arylamine N-acetyltransferase family protein [Paractinoplanes atraurantiacus]|uniref:N-hydroxyarylamine O-acetyltransferase n=1 Tax=Paractinoplanes atraurantiacus TaxID=1036182 RepID=A0A285J7B4_9ACTN|nr:arylamine N-acetyltransferase [Actinoplanes atraurantiacus]SNY55236.1 N-hydroxyarylamine O-acetyltransferase [Actinoplanes atraurantiacus]